MMISIEFYSYILYIAQGDDDVMSSFSFKIKRFNRLNYYCVSVDNNRNNYARDGRDLFNNILS